MTNGDICPECSREIPENAPAGICPHCLLQAGMESPAHEPTHLQQFQPPAVATLSPLFDQLEIESLLGQGGMGAVYRARQLKLDRLVALKLLRPESSANDSFAERFNREARTLARLSHPQIVGVHDFGELEAAAENESPQTLYYFLMEYVKGENLRQLMQSGPLPAERATSIVTQVCEALQYAHEEGVIHRDIKPENILIDARGRVKIADFGLAKLATPSEHDFTLTGTHQVMGTPRYMAPEQMAGSRAVDHRADLYSLGVVFYEMLTGEIPAGHFSPPSQHAAIDVRLDDVVMKALAQNPGDRFQSASEIRSSLEAIAQDETESVVSEPKTPVPARGISTIFEREIGAAWNWVVHPEKKSEGASSKNEAATFPLLLFLTLSLLGGLTILLPWAEIQIPQDADVTRIDESAKLIGPVAETYSGTEIWTSGAVSGTCLLVVFVLLLMPHRRSPGWIATGLMTILAVAAMILSVMYPFQIELEGHVSDEIEVSESASKTIVIFAGSSDGEIDPEAEAKRVVIPYSFKFWLFSDYVTYREGFYAALGISISLVLLSVVSVRNAILNREPKPTTTESWSGTPLESLQFSVPSQGDIGAKVKFHFLGQGYELAEERPGVWIFQRGRTMSAIFESDIRLYPTRLTVNSIDTDRGELLVNCHWSVRLMGGWARKKDIKILEDEGRKLQALLGGQIDEPADASVSEKKFGKRIDDTDVPDVSPRGESPPDSDRDVIDAVAVEEEVGSPAMAMIVFGLLSLLAHIGLMIFSLISRSMADNVWAFIPGILPALLMIIGGLSMRKLGSLSWSRIGIIGGLLPLSPAWIIHAVISTWAHQTLQKPHVKRAFLERARRRRELSSLEAVESPSSDSAEPSAEIDLIAVEDEVSGPAIAMIVVGLLNLLGHIGLILFYMSHRSIANNAWGWMPGLLPALLMIVGGLSMIVGGLSMRKLGSLSWSRIGIIGGLLPLSPAWLLTLPVSIWTIIVFRRPHVKRAFLERARRRRELISLEAVSPESSATDSIDLIAVEDEVSMPAIAMMAVGLLTLIGLASADFMILSNRSDPLLVWLSIPGLLVGLGMLVGGFNLKGLRSRGWAQLGAIAAMLPFHMAWLLTFPIGIWVQVVLNRLHVKRAFLERARQRRELISQMNMEATELDMEALHQEVSGPSMSLIIFGVICFLGHTVHFGFMLNSFENELAVFLLPGMLTGIMMVLSGLNIRSFKSRGTTQLGLILGMLPLNLGWPLTLPVSGWASIVFHDPSIKQAYLQRQHQRESANLRQKSLTGIFLFVLILLMLAGVLIGGLMLSSRQLSRHDDYVTVPHKPPEAVLHNAAAQGDIKQVKQSLDEGADVNDKDDHGQTPLMNAAKGGDPRMVAYLMLRGADEQARDPEGKTALMYAVELGHSDVVRMLLDLEQAHNDEEIQFRLSRVGPDVADEIDFSKLRFDAGRNLVDGQGESPLMKAAATGESDILDSLLLFSDDTLQDRRGRTALMHAIERRREDVLAPHFDKADAWLDALKPRNEYAGFIRPQTLAIADSDGWTPLARAEQIGLKKTAARIEGYLKSVIDRSTRLIEEDAQNSQAHYHHRALAYKALGETEKAEADFKASREPE